MKIAVCGVMPKDNGTIVSLDFGTDKTDVSMSAIIHKCIDGNWFVSLHDSSRWNHPLLGRVTLEDKDGTINGNIKFERNCEVFNVRIDVIPELNGWSISVTN